MKFKILYFVLLTTFFMFSMGYANMAVKGEIDREVIKAQKEEIRKQNEYYDDLLVPENEVKNQRGLMMKVYATGEGDFVSKISLSPQHYMDQSGGWKDVKAELGPGTGKFEYCCRSNTVQSFFPNNSKDATMIIHHITGTELSWKKSEFSYTNSYGKNVSLGNFADTPARSFDNKLVYENILSKVNEEYVLIDNGLEHNFILRNGALKDIPHFENMGSIHTLNIGFELQYSEDLRFIEKEANIEKNLEQSNKILVATGQDTLFVIRPPLAYDDYGEKVACRYVLDQNSDTPKLYIEVPLEWLLDPYRAYPITIDPDIYIYCNTYSGFVWRHYEEDSWGDCNELEYNYYSNMIMAGRGANNGEETNECAMTWGCDSEQDEDRGFAEFDISGINDATIIVDVDLRLYTTEVCADPEGSMTYLDIYHEGYRPSTVGTSIQWSDAGDGTRYIQYYLDDPTDDVGWKTLDLGTTGNTHVQNMLSSNWFAVGLDNYYVQPGMSFNDEVKIRNHTYGTSSYHPNLLVRYSYATDSYEPDNSCSDYTNISPSTSSRYQSHTISPTWNESSWQHDYDYFRFSAECGRRYYFYSSSNSWSWGYTDTYGELYTDDCGTLLASDDNSGGSYNFSLNWCCTSSGYYKLRVRGNSASTTLGPYRFYYYYTSPADCNRDSYESDNTCSAATSISYGISSTNHTLNQEGADEDWYSFSIPYLCNFYCYTTGSAGDTRMWLYRGSCSSLTQVAYDDNSGSGSFSRIDATCQPAGQYYIRVMGNTNVCNYTLYLSSLTDMRVGTTTLSTPTTGTRNVGNSVNFDWSTASGATSYRLYVNGSLVYNGSNSYYNGYASSNCTNYNWYVQPYNACTYTTSSTFNFRENGEPTSPSLVSPASGTRNVGNNPTLSWNAASDCDGDARTYQVYFGTSSPPPLYTTTSSISVPVTTGDCTTYYWRVRAYDGYEYSTYSATCNFVENGAPAAPTLSFPANGDSIEPEPNRVQWNTAFDCNGDGLTYAWYVDYDNPPMPPYLASGIASGLNSTLIDFSVCPGETLYWRVFALDGYESGAWSSTWHFRVMFPKVHVTIRTDIAGGIVTVDGTNQFSPYTVRWVVGSAHEISVPSPQLESGGVRYIFDHWSDAGARTHNIIVPAVDITYTAFMLAQYLTTITNDPLVAGDGEVIVDGSNETVPFTAWWDDGSIHDIEAIDSFTVGDTRYIWDDWNDGGDIAHPIMILSEHIYIANFEVQHYLTVHDGGHGPVYGEGWYAEGSSPDFSADSIADEDDGIRYRFDSWTGAGPGAYSGANNPAHCTINGPITETANWIRQYRFIVSNPTFADTPVPPVGIYWYDTGTLLTGHVNLIDPVMHVYATGYIGTGSLGSDIDTAFSTTLLSASTIEWQWAPQVYLIVTSEYGSPTPAGTTWYIPGTDIVATVPSPVYFGTNTRSICLGWNGTGSVTPSSGTTNFFDFTIMVNSTLTWNWELQYRFVVNNPGSHDTPVPSAGEHWYEEGTYIEGYINSHVDTFYCVGYTGGGVLPSAPGTTFAFYLTGPASITWNWEGASNIRLLTINSDFDYCFPPPGNYYYLLGSEVNASVIPPLVVDSLDTAIRYVCLGYTGTGSVFPDSSDTNVISFNINENSVINWLWVTQFIFTVMNPDSMGDPDPPVGSYWLDMNTAVAGTITSPIDTFFCTGYVGTGSLPSGYTNFFNFVIREPSSVIWIWDAYAVPFRVISDFGTPSPPVGVTFHGLGVEVTAVAGSPDLIAPGDRMVCTGYEGTGSVPATGTEDSISFNIMDTSSVTWLWKLQYRILVTSDHGSPVPPVGANWYDRGTSVDGWVELMAVEGVDTYWCSGYDGEGSIGDAIDTFFSCSLLIPSRVEWLWVHSRDAIILDVYSDHSAPYPSVGRHYYIAGTAIPASVGTPSYEIDGERWLCTGWDGTGSVPGTGDSNRVNFNMDDTSTITWNWRIQYRFTVNSAFGDPVPAVGEAWYDPGTEICGWVNRFDGIHVCTGYDGDGSLPDGVDTSFCFNIDTTSSVTWSWILFIESLSLVVNSAYGDPYPGVGINYYSPGAEVNVVLPETLITFGETRVVFTNWRGTGSLPASGEETAFSFTIDENSSLTWLWEAQYHIEVSYTGAGAFVPLQTGEGWYVEGTFAPIYSDSIVGAGDDWYFFMYWSATPEGADFADSTVHSTNILVDTCYDVVANYVNALRLEVEKRPVHREGYIRCDDDYHHDVSSIFKWVAPGSFHELGVSFADTTDTTRYYFDYWTGGDDDTITTVGPILSDMTVYANYWCVHYCTVKKEPWQENGVLSVDRYAWIGGGSAEQHFWWEEGTQHYLEASDPDLDGELIKYGFIEWNDGGEMRHWTSPISGPTEFIARYYKAYQCSIRKEPPHIGGSITFEDSVYEDTSAIGFWGIQDSSYSIGVSTVDLTYFYLYTFDSWEHGGTREQICPPITDNTVFQANYIATDVVVRFRTLPFEWHIGEVDVGDVVTMEEADVIEIVNQGTVPIDFGLRVSDGGDFWSPSYANGYNLFVLRSRFENTMFAPDSFHSSLDYVKSSMTWATDIIFGNSGFAIAQTDTVYLSMQFHAPLGSTEYMTEQVITVEIKAQVSLP
ncbi:hypothetical protein JXI42_09245 [bacterium]|nr:hypothetical protein [bacterium]